MSSETALDDIDLASIQKTLNLIECEDKQKRKLALRDLCKALTPNCHGLSPQLLDQVLKSILQSFNDPSEACRELAVNLMRDFVESFDTVTETLPLIMPTLTRRLGSSEIVEPSEEVRLSLVQLLRKVIKKSSMSLLPYFDDVILILVKTIIDPFPKIKKESCECVSDVAHAIPQQFHMQSESLVKPLLQTLSHQQYKIRVASVLALGVTVCKGNNKSIKDVSGPFAERFFDQTQQVRQAVTQAIGDWMINLPDRYSYFHILIPLLLTSLNDTDPSIQEQAWLLWNEAGKKWEQENEDDIKDKLDFLNKPPAHYPNNLRRPGLGCRMMVKRNLHKITPALIRELQDWLLDIRLKASQLLCILIVNVEMDVAQYSEQILQGMYRACLDEDASVVENISRAAYLMGHFLPFDNYWTLMYPVIQDCCHSGHLCTLAGLLSGTDADSLVPHISTISNFLQQRDICQSREENRQFQILKCCFALFDVCGKECLTVSQQLFNIIVTIHSLATSDIILFKAQDGLQYLQSLENLETVDKLYQKYMKRLLQAISLQPELWTIHTAERLIFQNLLLQSGPALGEFLSLVVPILSSCLHPNNPDAEMKLKVMSTMASVVQNSGNNRSFAGSDLQPFFCSLIQDVIAPNLVWKAGKTAEALRTISVSCLLALLQTHLIDSEEIIKLFLESVIPLLLAIIEDASRKTRLYTCQSLRHIVCLAIDRGKLTCEDVHKMYNVVLKRLDDVDDNVRKVTLELLHKIFTSLPEDYNVECSSSHVEALFSTLLIHLDDPNREFSFLILGVLKDISSLNPLYLSHKLKAVKSNFRNMESCENLMDHLDTNFNIILAEDVEPVDIGK